MSDVKKRDFIGSSKLITNQWGEMYKVGFTEEHLNRLIEIARTKRGWVNVVITKTKNGNAQCYIDDFVPTQKQDANNSNGDMPF